MKSLLLQTPCWICCLLSWAFLGLMPKPNALQYTQCVNFQANIQTEIDQHQTKYYSVLVTCRWDSTVPEKGNHYIFRKKYHFTPYMMEDILALISESEQKCRCENSKEKMGKKPPGH